MKSLREKLVCFGILVLIIILVIRMIDQKSATSIEIGTSIHLKGPTNDFQVHPARCSPQAAVPPVAAQNKLDPLCTKNKCPKRSSCFLGSCVCHPGYHGSTCDLILKPANKWFTANCPNLKMNSSLDINAPLELVGGEYTKLGENIPSCSIAKHAACAYLCYSRDEHGTTVVPMSLWRAAQTAEGNLWVSLGGFAAAAAASNDRAAEHWAAYDSLSAIPRASNLGNVLEVGAGPWTQLKGFLHIRPDLTVNGFTIWEPGADRYMAEVQSCSYKSGKSLLRWEGEGQEHPFPVHVLSQGGELLSAAGSSSQLFDTVISINVLEHVQDAFKYLTGLYLALKVGGTLIFHERYYDDETVLDGDLYHPVRVKRLVLDQFLSGFSIQFNNCSASYDGRLADRGYYVVAMKL